MSTQSNGGAIARESFESNSRSGSEFERSDQIAPVENMRAALVVGMEKLPDPLIRAMFNHLHRPRKRHSIDFRVSIWLPFLMRYYVNISAGREQRNSGRLMEEGLTSSSRLAVFYGLIAVALLGYCLFGIFCFLYILKSLLNINLFAGQSPFHPLYMLFVA